jgi:hypothetical protein
MAHKAGCVTHIDLASRLAKVPYEVHHPTARLCRNLRGDEAN